MLLHLRKFAILSTCLISNWLLQQADKVSGTQQTVRKMWIF